MKIKRHDGICLSCEHLKQGDCPADENKIWRDDLTRVVADCDGYKKMEVKNDSKCNSRCS